VLPPSGPPPKYAGLSNDEPTPLTGGADELASLKQALQATEQKLAAIQARVAAGPKVAERRVAVVDGSHCTACGICASSCPNDAIRLDRVAQVDASLCSGCGACAYQCPSNAIRMDNVIPHPAV